MINAYSATKQHQTYILYHELHTMLHYTNSSKEMQKISCYLTKKYKTLLYYIFAIEVQIIILPDICLHHIVCIKQWTLISTHQSKITWYIIKCESIFYIRPKNTSTHLFCLRNNFIHKPIFSDSFYTIQQMIYVYHMYSIGNTCLRSTTYFF